MVNFILCIFTTIFGKCTLKKEGKWGKRSDRWEPWNEEEKIRTMKSRKTESSIKPATWPGFKEKVSQWEVLGWPKNILKEWMLLCNFIYFLLCNEITLSDFQTFTKVLPHTAVMLLYGIRKERQWPTESKVQQLKYRNWTEVPRKFWPSTLTTDLKNP